MRVKDVVEESDVCITTLLIGCVDVRIDLRYVVCALIRMSRGDSEGAGENSFGFEAGQIRTFSMVLDRLRTERV